MCHMAGMDQDEKNCSELCACACVCVCVCANAHTIKH